ncbi:MAG TPA: hypothetical protein VHF01_03360 [Candidatus Acidoferrum sp.]|nr:hypothetical protein [Candidatus Acidoferrum sp.]
MRTIIALGLSCLLAVVLGAGSSPTHPQDKSTDIQYRLKEGSVSLHEPVVVLFEVHNAFSQPLTLTLGAQNKQFFQFSLTTPDGQVLQSTPSSMVNVVVFDGFGKAVVAPGEDYQQPLLMNQWFPFRTAGTYFLTSRLTTEIEISGDGNLPPKSQTIRLTVSARDPERLTKVCADLARQVEEAPNAEAAQEPALKLSYVEDPISVRYLAQVLFSHKLTDHIAIPGLERIGNDDAIKALLSALDDKFGDTADLARQALARMEDRISDPVLKETVRRALAPTPTD